MKIGLSIYIVCVSTSEYLSQKSKNLKIYFDFNVPRNSYFTVFKFSIFHYTGRLFFHHGNRIWPYESNYSHHHIVHSRLRFLSLSAVFPSALVCLLRLSVPNCVRLVVLSKYESIIRPIKPVRPGKSTKNRCKGCDGSKCGT